MRSGDSSDLSVPLSANKIPYSPSASLTEAELF